jgi:CubicO group peptidase (beta-lactamase class C family)
MRPHRVTRPLPFIAERAALAALAALACGGAPDDPGEPADPAVRCPTTWSDEVQATVDALEAERIALGAPGRAWAMLLDGEIVACGGLGQLAPDDPTPVAADTRFRIGSQTKSLTAAGLLHLVDDGQITLDTPVSDVLDGWDLATAPGTADVWTPRLLLSHQGAVVDALRIDDDTSLADWVEGELPEYYLMAPPGRFFNYSNPNYMMAGALIEAVTGEPYRAWMRDEVFAPLGLHETVFSVRDAPDAAFATGLGFDWDGGSSELVEQPPRAYDNPWATPAGYAWSTAGDMARLAEVALHGGALLSAEASAAWTSPQVDTLEAGRSTHYGLGWFLQDGHFDGGDTWWSQPLWLHGGDIPGYAADVILAPDDGFGLIALTSLDGAHIGGDVLVDALRRHAPRDPSPAPEADRFDPARLASYAGDYVDPNNVGAWSFAVEGDHLRMSMPLLEDYGIPYDPVATPIGRDTFLIEVQNTPLVLTFVDGDDGSPRWARTRSFVADRASDGARWASPTPRLDPAALRRAEADGPRWLRGR